MWLYRMHYSLRPQKFPQFTRPDGLIDKNPCRNATFTSYKRAHMLLHPIQADVVEERNKLANIEDGRDAGKY